MLNQRKFNFNEIPMSRDRDLIEYVLLLRYGPSRHRDITRPRLSVTAVSKALKIPTSTIYMLIKVGLTYLKNKELVYLIHPDTLKAMALLSVKQRAVMFHRHLP